MKVKEYEEFQEDCLKGNCNRRTMYNAKTCKTASKQKSCYPRYIKMLEKQQAKMVKHIEDKRNTLEHMIETNFESDVDLEWEKTKQEVWERDTCSEYKGVYKYSDPSDYCVIWKYILTEEERQYILLNHLEDFNSYKSLNNVHIESRQRSPELKYDTNNIILAHQYFHDLFDNYKDLVTRRNIDNDGRNLWIERFKKYVNEIN